MAAPSGEPTYTPPLNAPANRVAETNASGEVYTTEEIAQAFASVREQGMLDQLRQTEYQQHGAVSDDPDVQRHLWGTVSNNIPSQSQELAAAGLTELQIATLQLSAEALHYAYAQSALDRMRAQGALDQPTRLPLVKEASLFNGRIRAFVERFPETSAQGLVTALREVIAQHVSSDVLKSRNEDVIRRIDQVVNGARHEYGFGQLLPLATGVLRDGGHGDFDGRPATPMEDYEYTADYAVTMPDGTLVYIDVKSSAKGVGNKRPKLVPTEGEALTEPYRFMVERTSSGDIYKIITTWSYLDRENDAHFVPDKFYLNLPNEELQTQYHAIADMLLQAGIYFSTHNQPEPAPGQ
ncbi:hypothetical protein IRY61_04565 [Candidatus Saccharibacteria bacterium]|nr:hypothetical protein [Candidatus Saccharibacteria bacterium]